MHSKPSKQSTPAASLHRPIRPVMRTGQAGAPERRQKIIEPQAREGPVGANGARVALRSAGHSEHHQTP